MAVAAAHVHNLDVAVVAEPSQSTAAKISLPHLRSRINVVGVGKRVLHAPRFFCTVPAECPLHAVACHMGLPSSALSTGLHA